MEYRRAPEVEEVARGLLAEHHPHLLGVRVEFVFMSKTPKSKGREVWGRAKKVSGLNAFLAAGPNDLPEHYEEQPADFFVIEVSEEVWERLTAKGKRALVDEKLSCCEIETDEETGSVGLAVVGPDVAGFEAVIRRHGLWHEDLESFVKAGAEQLSFSEAVTDAAKELHEMGARMTVGSPRVDPRTGEVLAEART